MLERIADGDPTAVGECLERYRALVWSLARRHLRATCRRGRRRPGGLHRGLAQCSPLRSARCGRNDLHRHDCPARLIDRSRKVARQPLTQTLVAEPAAETHAAAERVDAEDQAVRARQFLASLRSDERQCWS